MLNIKDDATRAEICVRISRRFVLIKSDFLNVLDEILNFIESISEGFPTYSFYGSNDDPKTEKNSLYLPSCNFTKVS